MVAIIDREEPHLVPLLASLKKLVFTDRKLTLRLLWDLFMVWLALINLTLIAFDLTYLWLRPTYFRYVPVVTTVYDPVLGIEPHPLTEELLEEAERARELLRLDPESARLDEHLANLRTLTARVLIENPFERSGQTRNLTVMRVVIASELDMKTMQLRDDAAATEAAARFWSGSPQLLKHRFKLFDEKLRPLLAVNYYREYGLGGRLVDHFWILDLPFLLVFWVEFLVRWIVALRRRTHARWFFFPIFNWYDVLGLIPLTVFRPFRLLRAVSMYMRLRRSELSRVGKDSISRLVAYVSNIITEEVSDRVAIRILDEFAEEIENGTHRRIVHSTIGTRRGQIERVLAHQIGTLLRDEATIESIRELLRVNLEHAASDADALRAVPLPNAVLRPLVRGAGQVILDAVLDTVTSTLTSPDGEEAMEAAAASVIDQLFDGAGLEEVESLTKEITLHVIEHMKATVAVKKWAQPKGEAAPLPSSER